MFRNELLSTTNADGTCKLLQQHLYQSIKPVKMSYSLLTKLYIEKSSEQMDYKTQKRIQEMFRASEVITVNKESITPIYKVRKNVEKFSIKENDLKEYLIRFAPRDCKSYIDSVIQKIYHPTENDYQKDEVLKLSSLR